MADIRTYFANAYETTLATEMGPVALSAEVTSLAGAPSSPAYIVIEPDEPTRREYILFDGTFTATELVTTDITNRYLADSAEVSGITHPIGSTVRFSPTRQHFEDLHDRVESRLLSSAHTKTQHDGLGLDHTSLVNRDAADSHPIAAITNLSSTLDGIDPGIASLTEAERDGLTGGDLFVGRTIYNETSEKLEFWDGTAWVSVGSSAFHVGETEPTDPDITMWYKTGYVGALDIVTSNDYTSIVEVTQAEYDALTPDANTLYIVVG